MTGSLSYEELYNITLSIHGRLQHAPTPYSMFANGFRNTAAFFFSSPYFFQAALVSISIPPCVIWLEVVSDADVSDSGSVTLQRPERSIYVVITHRPGIFRSDVTTTGVTLT